ncbi:MAG TPA: 2TM domain-containing protein [Flavobacterium sp.]|nr:2TM domain-containing protein [Flavobacterium sp.]
MAISNNKYIREFPRAVLIGLAIFFIQVLIQAINGKTLQWDDGLKNIFLYTLLYTVSLHLSNTFLFITLDKFFADSDRFSKKRIIAGFISSFMLSLFVIFLLRLFEDVVIESQSLMQFFKEETASNYIVASTFTFIILLIVHFVYLYKWYQDNRIKEQKIIAGTASAKFESLKNQIDPHFLFNSLNVLSSLIEENPENAQRFTSSLSKIYRYVLEQKDKELVSVDEELSFAKTYMKLLKMRFENSVFYDVQETISNPEAKVVPLSLQLLLENTVKHNIASESRPLYVRIYEKGEYLVIENDYQKKEVLQERRGVGLQNIISRYAIITDRKIKIEQTEQHFRVEIPMLTKQVSIMETNYEDEKSIYLKAQKKVEDIKAFYGNLSSYIIVIIGLAILNLLTSPSHLWFFYPAVGWGIGVAVHGMSVFNFMPFLGSGWEERKIHELMNKDKSDKWR